jgi:hypothetical protein
MTRRPNPTFPTPATAPFLDRRSMFYLGDMHHDVSERLAARPGF